VNSYAHLVPNNLSRSQGRHVAGVGIDVSGIEKLRVREAMRAASLLIRLDIIQIAKVGRELDVCFIGKTRLSAHNYSVLANSSC